MSTLANSDAPIYRAPPLADWALHILAAPLLVVASVSSFAVGTLFGAVATAAMTVLAAITLPAGVPILLVCAFLFQNLVVAWYSPLIGDNDAFDTLRAANFIIQMSAYGVFLAASLQDRLRWIPGLRRWLLGSIAVLGVVCVYFALGAAQGVPKDALVYFRNIITPIACFHIALVCASLYRIELDRPLFWIGLAAIAYGYCELVFTMDFLSLFHGDAYIERDIWRQIQSGHWEKAMQQTGFVLRGLEDVMMTSLFNSPLLSDLPLRVFRIGGPNFHAISYAYALAVISCWFLIGGRWGFLLLALPLLLVIGSKGALFLVLLAMAAHVGCRVIGARPVLFLVPVAGIAWAAAATAFGIRNGDYHVLGLLAGVREFVSNPIGLGLGFGGNLSSAATNVDWDLAQASGATDVPLESAVGVLLYQMGLASSAIFILLGCLAAASARLLLQTGKRAFLFAYVAIIAISVNALLQEEAFFSPLALGLGLLLVGSTLGQHLRSGEATMGSNTPDDAGPTAAA